MRRGILAGLALLMIVLIHPASAPAGAPADTIRLGLIRAQSFGGLFIAEREGHFRAQRIAVEWAAFTAGAQMIPPLAQRQLDVAAGGASAAFFNAVLAGQRIRMVADKGHIGKGAAEMIVIRKTLAGTVTKIADLRGRRVAISFIGGLDHYLLSRALASGGLSVRDVTITQLPQEAALAALGNAAVDAAVFDPLFGARAITLGAAVKLVDYTQVINGEPIAFIIYGPTLLERNRDAGIRFMIAYLTALQQYNQGPTDRNVAIVAEYTNTDPESVRQAGWVPIHADGFVDVQGLRRQQDWYLETGLVNARAPIGLVLDASFLRQARQALGIAGR